MALPLVGSSPYGPAPSLPLSLPLSLSLSLSCSLSRSLLSHSLSLPPLSPPLVLMLLISPLEDFIPPTFPLHSSMCVVLLVRVCGQRLMLRVLQLSEVPSVL